MSRWQDRLVVWALILSESAWVFVILGAVGAAAGRGGSPMAWPPIVAIMALSLVMTRLGRLRYASLEITNLIRTLVGAGVVYVSVGTQVASGASGIDLAWIGRLGSDTAPDGFTFVVVTGSVVGALMWLRAGHVASVEFPAEALGFSFRLGLLGFAFATLLDIAIAEDLRTFPMIFVFFASGLLGLSIGHLLPESRQSAQAKTWQKVIGGLVSSVLLVGLFFSLVNKDLLERLSAPLWNLVSTAAQALVWAIVIPIAFVLDLFFNLLISFFSKAREALMRGEMQEPRQTGDRRFEPGDFPEESVEELPPLFEFVIQVIEWVFVGLIVLVLLYLLSKVIRRVFHMLFQEPSGQRESVRDEADPMMDLAKLLLKLIPNWIRRPKRAPGYTLPDGPPGVVEAIRLYYDLLSVAEKRGIPRPPHETASEFQGSLEELFPGDLVRIATEAFNNAFYGHHSAAPDQIASLRSSLRDLATGPA